ncbi:MFS transporter [Haloarchaeobius sp. HRN-SO-5]|uniref:MFS transporter n=1 Tax=Haloarchaeobius sp. HRN-SO-5 TaxID=3446118 RepID=UPI003EBD99A4
MSTPGRRAWTRWRAYPDDYRRFCGVIFVAGLAYGFVDILVPLYGDSFGVSNLTIGLLFAVFSLPKSIISPLVGLLADRMGHRRNIVASGFVLAGLLYGLVPVLGLVTAFLAIRFLLGGLDAAIRPTAQTLVSEVGGDDGRGQSFGLYSSFRTFGTVVGPVVAGVLIAVSGFLASFAVTGALFVAAGVLTYVLVAPEFGPESENLSPNEALSSIRESVDGASLRTPSAALVVLYCIVFLRFLGLHAYVRFLPLYLEVVGFAPGAVGTLFSVRTLSAAVCFPFGGRASDRFGRLPVLASGVLLSGVAPVVLYLRPSLPWVVGGLLVAGVGRALFIPTLPAYISDVSLETARGSQLGGVAAVSSLAVGVAPLAAGALGDAFTIAEILVFAGAALGLSLALFGVLELVRE